MPIAVRGCISRSLMTSITPSRTRNLLPVIAIRGVPSRCQRTLASSPTLSADSAFAPGPRPISITPLIFLPVLSLVLVRLTLPSRISTIRTSLVCPSTVR